MEWVSVEDRLPSGDVGVLCFVNDIVNSWQEVLNYYECPEYGGHEWSFLNGDECPAIVTHWMPLPLPPEE